MNKKIKTVASLKIPSGEASSKPPLGSLIGQFGVPIMDFCNLFNKISTEQNFKKGIILNCNLFIYTDFSFSVEIRNVDLSFLLKCSFKNKIMTNKKELSTKKGRVQSLLYGVKKRNKRKKRKKFNLLFLSTSSLYEITKIKYQMIEKNKDIEFYSFYKSVFGTCRSMGFLIYTSNQFNNSLFFKETFFLNLLLNESQLKKKWLITKPRHICNISINLIK